MVVVAVAAVVGGSGLTIALIISYIFSVVYLFSVLWLFAADGF